MTTPPRLATKLNRPAAPISLSKNSRRHGDGKQRASSSCTAARSASVAGAMVTSSTRVAPARLRLRQADVDRRDVGVLREPPRLRDGARAPRAARRRVAAAQELRDGEA